MHVLRDGLILGAVVGAYTVLVAAAGWFTNNLLAFWLVLLIELLGAAWFLRRGAARGNGYLRQVGEGTLAFAVAAVVLFVVSYVALSVVAPDYADVIVDAQRQRILATGNPPADLEERLARLHAMYTPIRQSSFVVPWTVITGLAFCAPLAIFLRRRGVGHEP